MHVVGTLPAGVCFIIVGLLPPYVVTGVDAHCNTSHPTLYSESSDPTLHTQPCSGSPAHQEALEDHKYPQAANEEFEDIFFCSMGNADNRVCYRLNDHFQSRVGRSWN